MAAMRSNFQDDMKGMGESRSDSLSDVLRRTPT
jgi:hypothetical protein